jgi:hypothetical protein
MSEDEFTRLFRYVSEWFADANRRLDEKASQKSVDMLIKQLDNYIK